MANKFSVFNLGNAMRQGSAAAMDQVKAKSLSDAYKDQQTSKELAKSSVDDQGKYDYERHAGALEKHGLVNEAMKLRGLKQKIDAGDLNNEQGKLKNINTAFDVARKSGLLVKARNGKGWEGYRQFMIQHELGDPGEKYSAKEIDAINANIGKVGKSLSKLTFRSGDQQTDYITQGGQIIKQGQSYSAGSKSGSVKGGKTVFIPDGKGGFTEHAGYTDNQGKNWYQNDKGDYVIAPPGHQIGTKRIQGKIGDVVPGFLDKTTRKEYRQALYNKRTTKKQVVELLQLVQDNPGMTGIAAKWREKAGGYVGQFINKETGEFITGASSKVLNKARTLGGKIARDVINAGTNSKITKEDKQQADELMAILTDSTNTSQAVTALKGLIQLYDKDISDLENVLSEGKIDVPTKPQNETPEERKARLYKELGY